MAAPNLVQQAMTAAKESGLLKTQGFINGEWRSARSGKTLAVVNPALGSTVAEVPFMSAEETREAVSAAAEAFGPWSATSAKHRGGILRKWFSALQEHKETLATIMTLEQGKPLAEARREVDYGAGYVELYAEELQRQYGDIIPSPFPDRRILITRHPVGVVSIITPWNFPIAMITRKVAPALAAGCTVVVKPAELTPLSALAMVELATRAGVPKGVFNVVIGDAPAIGEVMLGSDLVRKLSFTGSTNVGRKLMALAAPTIKKLSMELGGNAPFLVFDDADLKRAVAGAIGTKFRNAGQTCISANRFLVQEGIHDKFVETLKEEIGRAMTLGNGLDPGVSQGPLINEQGMSKVERHIEDAVSKGAKVVLGGKRWKPKEQTEGEPLTNLFFEPTILVGCTSDMLSFREEVFGPVAPIFKFRTEEEGVRMANDTEFGLASYVYTENTARSFRVSGALQSGMVGVNEAAISNEAAPFGGVKQSGFGREGSKYGLHDYQDMKYVCLGGLSG